jgi:hypothetical protein
MKSKDWARLEQVISFLSEGKSLRLEVLMEYLKNDAELKKAWHRAKAKGFVKINGKFLTLLSHG